MEIGERCSTLIFGLEKVKVEQGRAGGREEMETTTTRKSGFLLSVRPATEMSVDAREGIGKAC